ncbi:hypothetical protein E2C01_057538 [Portunus trituberculatus]|uniref:Uncharacterized protein n=1 Tax=Portunus trituberculatus TaxID=210409 RepID=A0A5B7GT59_PORTR|nr:hypothetical protein [Portunus trituberculatus]
MDRPPPPPPPSASSRASFTLPFITLTHTPSTASRSAPPRLALRLPGSRVTALRGLGRGENKYYRNPNPLPAPAPPPLQSPRSSTIKNTNNKHESEDKSEDKDTIALYYLSAQDSRWPRKFHKPRTTFPETPRG